MKNVFVQLLILLFCFALINIGVKYASHNSVSRQSIKKAKDIPDQSTIFIGNSLLTSAIDLTEFSSELRVVNTAVSGSLPSEHYVLWRCMPAKKPKTIVYGIYDLQMTSRDKNQWEDLLGNRSIAYLAPDEESRNVYANDNYFYHFVSFVPAFIDRSLIWTKVEIIRRKIGEIGLPKTLANQFGRASDFILLEKDPQQFRQQCSREFIFSRPVEKLMTEVCHSGAKVWVVLMPMPKAHRNRYYNMKEWQPYRATLFSKLTSRGVRCVDASDWIEDSMFLDAIHLNKQGATPFSRRLNAMLMAQEQR